MDSGQTYLSIFEFPEWSAIGVSVLQTVILFALVFGGLRLIGRKVFSERSPMDLVLILLVAEAGNFGLTNQNAGFWGAFFSILALFFIGYLVDRITFLREFLREKPLLLYRKGYLYRETMKQNMVDEDELYEMAREKGFPSYKNFEAIILESGGKITAIEPMKAQEIFTYPASASNNNIVKEGAFKKSPKKFALINSNRSKEREKI